MKRIKLKLLSLLLAISCIISSNCYAIADDSFSTDDQNVIDSTVILLTNNDDEINPEQGPLDGLYPLIFETSEPEPEEEPIKNNLFPFSYDQISFMALVVFAEAGSTSEMCIRMVIDTILNMYDDDRYPNDLMSILTRPGAFSVVESGAIYRYPVQDYILDLIYQEMECRVSTEVGAFRTDYYHSFGTPLCCIDNVYFSAY